MLPVSLAWLLLAMWLGRRHRALLCEHTGTPAVQPQLR
jgi:hypothetical protein